MKSTVIILSMISALSCAQKKYTLIPTISGLVLDETKRPVAGAMVDVYKPNSIPINIGMVLTDTTGRFVKEGLWRFDFHTYFMSRKYISYILIIKKKGYATDTLNILEHIQRYEEMEDTIDIGSVYLAETLE